MTHWLEYSEADFDAARAAGGRRTREAHGRYGLFFVATPVKAKRAPELGAELPGQASIFDTDTDTDTEE